MSPGRDGSDTDMEPTASQSQDCEPTPPLQRHDSKNNFYLPPPGVHHTDSNALGDVVGGMDSHSVSRSYVTRPSPHCRTRYEYLFFLVIVNLVDEELLYKPKCYFTIFSSYSCIIGIT